MTENAVKKPSLTGAGEVVERPHIRVVFQKGAPKDVGINGVRVQDVIQVAIDRLLHFQAGPLACQENEDAIEALQQARASLDERARRRKEQGVLDTMQPHVYSRTEDEIEDFSATGA